MYSPDTVRNFYNGFGVREWDRLDSSAHARLMYHLHLHALRPHIGAGRRVLDAGCGAGRFSLDIAASGSCVTLVDIAPEQLDIARSKLEEQAYTQPGLLDTGEMLMAICQMSVFG